MQKRNIGQTGLAVSRIGLGTVKFGRNQGVKYPESFELPTDSVIKNLLECARALGINLLDTAPAYGNSEARLGKLLKDECRHQWIISTKVGETFVEGESRFDFSKEAVISSIEQSLTRLRTDYLDIVLVHSDGNDVRIILDESIFLTLERLKQAGKIRAFGMSTKTCEGGMLTIDHADLAMVTFNPTYQDERQVIDYAYRMQKGIFIKKGLLSGHLAKITSPDPIHQAMQCIFAVPGVTSLIVGTINPEHLRENVEKAF